MKYTYEFSIWIDGKNSGSWSKKIIELLQRIFKGGTLA